MDLWIVASHERLLQAIAVFTDLPQSLPQTLALVFVGGVSELKFL
jgi:hypothetical protein